MGRIAATWLALHKSMTDILLVITNLPDAESAQKLARLIIDARAAACVNQLAPCISTYRWQDKLETACEVPLLIKTTPLAYSRLETLILAAHPYELPEIIAMPVCTGLPAYLNWVDQQTVNDNNVLLTPAPGRDAELANDRPSIDSLR